MLRNNRLLTLLFLTLLCTCVRAQTAFNTTLRDNLTFPSELNDVWGYVAPDGTEYAIVGRNDGISIVSLADPDNIEEVGFIAGGSSIWRDIKTYGEYAYVVADQQSDGIVVIDLTNLPNSVSSQSFNSGNTSGSNLVRAHNIYIDVPTGLAYISGSNVNSGGMVVYDVATTPGTPTFVSFAPAVYAHDVYVQDGVMYASEINGGELTLYDVSDPLSITAMASTSTPFNFTHNAWTDASGDYVYTTDERSNAPVAAYDISDLNDIMLIDEFRPARSAGTGTIPHNVHVLDDYLAISYYTDGVEIVDASVPDNLVEIAFYDHWSGGNGGFNGSWGAYPFLPSGLVLSTDISNGLFVVEVNYQRAARLRGVVTDEANGAALNGVSVTVASPLNPTVNTNALGRYKTGIPSAGEFMVTYSLAGYNSISFPLTFENGVEIIKDTFLVQKIQVAVTGDVTSTEDGGAIAGAEVRLSGEDGTAEEITNAAGTVNFGTLFTGMYDGFAGAWGFRDVGQAVNIVNANNVSFQLEPGFRDGFAVDQGWTVSGDASTGAWERGVPVGTSFEGNDSNPGEDVAGDVGDQAYVTGNAGGGAGSDDVDGGTTTLRSPPFAPEEVGPEDVLVSYDYWFFNDGGNSSPDDEMTVSVFNGTDRETIKTYTVANATQSAWTSDNFTLSDLSIALTATMQIEFSIGDTGGGHLVEGGVDNFEMMPLATLPLELTAFTAEAVDKRTAQLNWTTQTEINSSHFMVQRSIDGVRFTTIGQVSAMGNTTSAERYVFRDTEAFTGSNYYRLKMIDLDGSFAYSDTKTVAFAGEGEQLLVYPNPATDFLYFAEPVNGPVRIYGMDGRLVREIKAEGDRIDTSELVPGTYLISLSSKRAIFIKNN